MHPLTAELPMFVNKKTHFFILRVLLVVFVTISIIGCTDGSDGTAQTKGNIDTYIDNAVDYQQKSQYKAAVIEARNAIQQFPENARGHRTLANILLEIGQPRQAINILEPLEQKDSETALLLAKSYLEVGKIRSAREMLTGRLPLQGSPTVELTIMQARLSLAERDYASATTLFNQALAADAANIEALLGLAGAALGELEYATARERLEEILTLDTDNSKALLMISRMEGRAGDLDKEESYLMQIISTLPSADLITPLRYAVLVSLRDNLTKQGKVNEALIYSAIIAESLPDADEYMVQMQSVIGLLEAGDFEEARQSLEELKARKPGSEQVTTMLAVVDFLQGDDEAAAIKFEDVIDPETSSPTTLQLYAITELRLNPPEKVIERLWKDIDSANDSRLNALYAVALASSGKLADSEKYFLRSVELEPDRGRLYLPLAQLYNLQGKTREALESLQTAFEKEPADPMVQRALVAQYLANDNPGAADEMIKSITSTFPENQQTQLIAANYYLQRQELASGEAALKRVLKLGPSRIAQHQYARVLIQKEQYSAAADEYRDLISQNGDDSNAYKGLITTFELLKEVDKGLAEVESLHEAGTTTTHALVLSEYYGRNGLLRQSEEWLEKYEGPSTPQSIRVSEFLIISKARVKLADNDLAAAYGLLVDGLINHPDSARILASLITLQIRDRKLDEAQNYLEQLTALSTEPIVLILRGDLEAARGNFLAAREAYTSAWEQAPTDQTAFKLFGSLQSGKRTPEEIVAFLNEWLQRLPESNVAAITKAGFLLSTGELEQAQTDYQSLIEQNSDNVIALNNIAWTYGEKELDKALAASQAAYKLASDRPEIIDTYGWFLFKSGDTQQAVALLQEAAGLAPDNEEIKNHLIEASAAMD
jgi:predicted Zn-dependent protease